ncbi:hypothetical protein [Brachybacterium sacelli]|uniref:GIY-YIG domain-containing protein n=1 Tax=Brachybacterium sacelli TaxID=173364 RepID=A0ABS4X5J4_9MICO|nr:hypothetical protein [Brachybacterium sacelli]MBP2383717.1 hypothetical protein [Brachybacterium sacelli]
MVKLMTVDELIKTAEAAGIPLVPALAKECNLYAITDPEGNCLYVGQSASKSGRRVLDEISYRREDPTTAIRSGIVALLVENHGSHHPWRFDPDPFDASRLKAAITDQAWEGGAIDVVKKRLDSGTPPKLGEVEEFLVRSHIRTGCLIGNSEFASQWDGPIGKFADTVAVLAVLTGDVSRRSQRW